MATTNSDFPKRQRLQKCSKLIQLPAEIRVKILRSLLKSDDPIPSFYNAHGDRVGGHQKEIPKYQSDLQLSSQILRVCQKLYEEAHHILYAENTLRVQIAPTSCNEMNCSVLKYRAIIPGTVDALGKTESDLFSPEYPLMYMPRNGTYLHSATDYELDVLKLFSAYEVRLEVWLGLQQQNIYVACRLLRNLLHGKRVKIILPYAVIWNDKRVDVSGCFKVLRCRAIKFYGVKAQQSLQDLVTSNESSIREDITRDTLNRWFSFLTTFVDKLPIVNNQHFAKANKSVMDSLLQQTMSYDDEGFSYVQKVVMEMAIKWNQQWQAAEREAFRKKYEQMKNDVVVANASIKAMLNSGRRSPSLEQVDSSQDG